MAELATKYETLLVRRERSRLHVTLNRPEVMVPFAHEKIDDKGRLTDRKTTEHIASLLEALVTWTRRLKSEG